MPKRLFLFLLIIILTLFKTTSQDLIWTGAAAEPEFFDDNNWEQTTTGTPPEQGTLTPGNDINLHLTIENAPTGIFTDSIIILGSGSLTLINADLAAPAISSGSVTIGDDAYLELSSSNPVPENTQFDLLSGIGWLKLPGVAPGIFLNDFLPQFKSNGQPADYPANLRIDNYYHRGTIVRREDLNAEPLRIFNQTQLGGAYEFIKVNQRYQGNNLPGQMNNNIESFVLKRGYMLTMAQNEDGTGLSKVFIASEEDLIVPELPSQINGVVSFVRVVPWNWIAKKGIGGNVSGLHESWYYNWGLTGNSTANREIAPMAWGWEGASDSSLEILKNKYKATHVMGFNEPDDCDAQSGQWYNMCQTDVAVERYRHLMKTGLRLISPGTREEEALNWLKEFYIKATEQNIRIDVIAVHWYDWGGNPANTPNANPQNVFNRFKNYLANVYEYYGLPIWITEFNANIHRNTAVNEGFLELALPYLESLEYVERYAWFQPFSGVAHYYDNGTYTNIGLYYRDLVSTPAVAGTTVHSPNNLDGKEPDVTNVENEIRQSTIRIFPNPAADILHISNISAETHADIYDLTGMLVSRKNISSATIDVSSLNPGVYFISIGNTINRFVKL